MKAIAAVLALLFVLVSLPCTAQQPKGDDHLQWWRDARFGLFVHWGPVSIKGTEIGWSRGGKRPGIGGTGEIPVDVYDNLYKQFNPVKFDAKEWVAMAKDAGMKYIVFTSKHHDGFCMFDSALTDYKITNSPFKRDVVGELAQACHEAGMKIGFYYSPPDFHHPDYRSANHAKYIEYLHGQLREICTKYGKIDIIWFDGLNSTTKELESEKLVKMIRELQPGVVINNRSGLPEDYDTPEQVVGHFNRTRPWETCMTMGDQWAYKPHDNVKSYKKCHDILINCVGGDGNLLLNIGPTPLGDFEPAYKENLAKMGAWLKKYGESVYGTRGGPFKPGAWGASTCHGNFIYLHLLTAPSVVLPKIDAKIKAAVAVTGGTASIKETDEGVMVAASEKGDPETLIRLEVDGPAVTIPPVSMSGGGWGVKVKATASNNVYQKMQEYGPDKAVDEDENTRWATDSGTHQAWLEVATEKPIKVGEVKISEACGERVEEFELQYKNGDAWKTFYKGTKIGPDFHAKFEPVTASAFRLDIKKANEGPTIWEFALLPAK